MKTCISGSVSTNVKVLMHYELQLYTKHKFKPRKWGENTGVLTIEERILKFSFCSCLYLDPKYKFHVHLGGNNIFTYTEYVSSHT